MTDRLKFIKDVEAKAIGLSGSKVRRSFDALDELRIENSRLRRELDAKTEENRQLREQLRQPQAVPIVVPTQIAPPEKVVPSQDGLQDDSEVRFSLMELK